MNVQVGGDRGEALLPELQQCLWLQVVVKDGLWRKYMESSKEVIKLGNFIPVVLLAHAHR